MLSLSPAKILVVLVVALIVLGPDKLPGMARQAGALWHDLRRLRGRLESEVRGVFPDLPSTQQVAQAVRSPLAYLDDLADRHAATVDATEGVGRAVDGASDNGSVPTDATAAAGVRVEPALSEGSMSHGARWAEAPEAGGDDPSMN
jgi:sec-independent protein translocase protein TatB